MNPSEPFRIGANDAGRLTVVLQRRPPSPSIQTSDKSMSVCKTRLRTDFAEQQARLTFCLDLATLVKLKVALEEIGLVVVHGGHCGCL